MNLTTTLTSAWLRQGAWLNYDLASFTNLSAFSTFEQSRALAVNVIPSTNNTELLLVCESGPGNITVLHGTSLVGIEQMNSYYPNPKYDWTWENVTDQLYSFLSQTPGGFGQDSRLAAPFTISLTTDVHPANGSKGPSLEITFYLPTAFPDNNTTASKFTLFLEVLYENRTFAGGFSLISTLDWS